MPRPLITPQTSIAVDKGLSLTREGDTRSADARGRGHPIEHREQRRATASSDELSRPTSRRYLTVGRARRAAEGGQVAPQGRVGRRALLCYDK
eukprot:scaffold133494_cov112-Phaeocystis_antarctica.AAC.1